MTIISCTEMDLRGSRDLTWSLEEGIVGKRSFQVVTDNRLDLEWQVISSSWDASPNPLPRFYDLWPGSDIGRCTRLHPSRPFEDTKTWLIEAEYKTVFGQQERDRAAFVNPLERPSRITGGSRTVMMASRFALRTKPYSTWPPEPWSSSIGLFKMQTAANSASDPLDPPIDVPWTEWEIRVEKNVSELPWWYFTYANCVNNADQVFYLNGTPNVIPMGCGKLGNFSFSEVQNENDVSFITIGFTVTIRYRRPPILTESAVSFPWDTERLDEGSRVPEGTGWKVLKDKTGSVTLGVVPFDGAGAPIDTSGAPIPETSLKRFCYRTFPVGDYSVLPWS